jgi:hypothetical protein
MKQHFIIKNIDGLYWNGKDWDITTCNAKKFSDRGSAITHLLHKGQIETLWLLQPCSEIFPKRNVNMIFQKEMYCDLYQFLITRPKLWLKWYIVKLIWSTLSLMILEFSCMNL